MKKLLSLLLCVCLFACLSPAALAAGEAAPCAVTQTQSWEEFGKALSLLPKPTQKRLLTAGVGSAYANGRVIARLTGELPDLSRFDVQAILRDPEGCFILQLPDAARAEACADYLGTLEGLVYVEPDAPVFQDGEEQAGISDGIHAWFRTWGVGAVHADEYAKDLAGRGKTGPVTVAVVDSGVDADHPLLRSRTLPGYDFVELDDTPQDETEHGTHVSGIVADCTPGLNVRILPVRVFDSTGKCDTLVLAAGIHYAVEHGADVINLSLGGAHSRYKEEAVERAIRKGISVVTSAGNDAMSTERACPSHIFDCLTVTAVDRRLELDPLSNYGPHVDLAAPGVGIRSAVPGGGYGYKSGTSMAAPFVSAAAAMLLCDYPALRPDEVSALLRDAAEDLGDAGWDVYYGAGFLNLRPFVGADALPYGPDCVLPASLTAIDAEAFAGSAFRYVKLAEGTVSIGARAFADCVQLTHIYIPETTTEIAEDAFAGDAGLTILGQAGSAAERYASARGFAFRALP